MVDHPPAASVIEDVAFKDAQRHIRLVYDAGFDKWVIRVKAENERLVDGPSTYAERLANGPRTNNVVIVQDLARLCLHFIVGDLNARAWLFRRQGFSVEGTVEAVAQHVTTSEGETYQTKWQVGLRQIDWGWFKPVDGEVWTDEAWAVVVKEAVADWVGSVLAALLDDDQRTLDAEIEEVRRTYAAASTRASELAREAVNLFRLNVYLETGQKVTKKEIALVAGYKNMTELHRFQRNDKRLTKSGIAAFERTLQYEPAMFLELLTKRRLVTSPKGAQA